MIFPEGKDFIFSIFDDTDVATLDYIRPIYDELSRLDINTTKSVWPLSYSGKCDNSGSHTLEHQKYAEYIVHLKERGFEIGLHGASMVSCQRNDIEKAFDLFLKVVGHYPRIYSAHATNCDNLYWGMDRFSFPLFRYLYQLLSGKSKDFYQGHQEGSPYFWGDLALKHLDYVRNFTYRDLNLLNISKFLPYSDKNKPLVKHWFFTCDADNVEEFNLVLQEKYQDQLAEEKGICIISTHFGKGFIENGKLNEKTGKLLHLLSQKNGWFVPVSTILDFLLTQQTESSISKFGLFRLEYQWFKDLLIHGRKRKSYNKTELPYLGQ
jgi:hypothetical protein